MQKFNYSFFELGHVPSGLIHTGRSIWKENLEDFG